MTADLHYHQDDPGAACVDPDELPAGAAVEPWTDADDAEALAVSARALWSVLLRHANALRSARIYGERLTDDELATAAALAGIVADAYALPMNKLRSGPRDMIARNYTGDPYVLIDARRAEATDRQRETGDVWANARRHYRNLELVAVALGRAESTEVQWAIDILTGAALPFPESRQRADHDHAETHPGRYASWPIIQAGIAARNYPKPPHDPRSHTYRRPVDAPSQPMDLDR